MSKQDELKAKLTSKQIRRKAIFDDIESLRSNESDVDAEIADLKKQIADAEKPKLRHGDYGYSDMPAYLRISLNGKLYYPAGECSCSTGNELNHVLGNIFDDLTAMQEDVTEFSLGNDEDDGVCVSINDAGCLKIKDLNDNSFVQVYKKEIPAFILGLSQVHATYLRKKGSE